MASSFHLIINAKLKKVRTEEEIANEEAGKLIQCKILAIVLKIAKKVSFELSVPFLL